MKLTIIIILIVISSFSLFGNDGVYLSSGGVIYPTKETKISLDREILSFKVQDDICTVNILFEFNNPEKNERKLLIGFQAPTASGDVTDEICNTNQIADFKIFSDGKLIPYKLKKALCEDCELKETKDLYFTQDESGVFVYLFEYTFKPGINRINQSYTFPRTANVIVDEIYDYILETGAKWAGGKIKNLTVQIDYGDNKYFYVNDIFEKNANWTIIGTGKITDEKIDKYFGIDSKMVRILSGKLQIDITNFKPENNIEFGVINRNSFFT